MLSNNVAKTDYKDWLINLKQKFQSAQIKAHTQVNSTLLEFYWNLGQEIVAMQELHKWGSGFLQQLSTDLSAEFENIKGFLYRNLKYIRQWFMFWQQAIAQFDQEKGKQVVAQLFQIPWGHNIAIVQKCKNIEEALYYVQNTIKNSISRNVLVHQIESNLYARDGKAITNFTTTLPAIQSDLAKEITKDPYNFDFLCLREDCQEKELEDALCENITKFLLELGQGFAFIGRQKHIMVGEQDFYIDLLFYHTKLHCYVVVELKANDFKPEYAGKLSFYTSVVDGEIKSEEDNPTIGILLCKGKNKTVVEYALKDVNKPIGVSEYQLTHELTGKYKSALPTIEQIEAELDEK
ncbi:PDDEXK nuclease domain-containing protein [Francisella tularensis]|uniref:PDDEXK nuclease domain-containing protein n=1 Tax=Francisella tularensis TaxID=263 RepID=UPI0008F4E96A|nr:PDDEXK nuclease domain-containing protein [Francisella tularensis]APA82698.1 Putative cytoplasmic protein [Francisella tularensis subsp. novicida PA10-7858]